MFKPLLTLKVKVININDVKTEEYVSYGDFKIFKNMTIATISIGYVERIYRNYSEKEYLYYNNIPCKIIGKITMDYTIIDVIIFVIMYSIYPIQYRYWK